MSDHDLARLETLLGFREHDPGNRQLTVDCAEAALAADRPELAYDLLHTMGEGLDGEAANLAGIAAMRSGNHEAAQVLFRDLLASHPEDLSLRFNLAWSLALGGDKEGALEMLDSGTIDALPQAAMLDLQLRHEAGQWTEAAERLPRYLARHPGYGPLQAAAAVLAMDLEDVELARRCAIEAGEHPDAITTLALLDLGESHPAEAKARFVRALEMRPGNPRARIGLGLAKLAEGQRGDATEDLDAGAREFGDHLGSWIAAGWAHALAGDLSTARERFETALKIDDTFAEAHGSLAAIDVMQNDGEAARRGVGIALRLDRNCFSAALASVLLASGEGDADRARAIFEGALQQAILPGGETLGTALAKLAR